MRIFGREPALWISAISATLAMLLGFGLPGINDTLIAAVTAFLTAAAAAWTAIRVHPVAPAVFTGVITTGATLLAAFGLNLAQHQVSLIASTAGVLMALVVRAQVIPLHTGHPAEPRSAGTIAAPQAAPRPCRVLGHEPGCWERGDHAPLRNHPGRSQQVARSAVTPPQHAAPPPPPTR